MGKLDSGVITAVHVITDALISLSFEISVNMVGSSFNRHSDGSVSVSFEDRILFWEL